MRHLLLLAIVAMTMMGCSRSVPSSATTNATTDRDNTAVNQRDREATTKTPIDQNENQADIDVTANIRKRVVDADLSVNAQNVKVITQDGKVTLRGPVNSDDEKKRVEEIAHSVAGADKVESQLEVQP